jgi:predicted alpha-1,2-mannosidase
MSINDRAPHPTHRRKLPVLVLTVGVILGLHPQLRAYTLQSLTTNVQPLNGTANGGDTFPGVVVPFGMVQWSPDTTTQNPGNYLYSDTQIHGFGLTQASGAGCNYGGDIGFTPFLGSVASSPYSPGNYSDLNASYFSTFSHSNEIATPGYYSVKFTNGILTELTTTTRTGFGRFAYPSGNTASMLINAGGDANGTINASIQINPGGNEISGWTQIPGMCGPASAVLYFDVVFNTSFATYGVWNGSTLTANGKSVTGAESGAYLSFNLSGGGVVLAHTALSYVSVANAQANLASESPVSSFTSAGFDAMTSAASNTWNGYLNKIQVSGGTAADTATFYTMMYHALQAPEVVSDVNGQYMGYDGTVHTLSRTQYGWFSGWDIYRSECQFVAMMDPAQASDMAQSLVQDATDGGAMPRWGDAVADTGIMIGDSATPIIAGMYAFGATNFNTTAALAAMVKAAVNPVTQAKNGVIERDANRDYLNLGFVPENEIGGYGPVSMTLEYCSDDFALGQFAKSQGDTTTYTQAMNRAQNWRNHFNTSSGYLQMRRSDSLWSPGFNSDYSTYDNYDAFVEGTGAQYVWMVPFNLGSLINLMGGPQVASTRLDTFFTELNDSNTGSSPYAYMGNEPCSETPWIYSFLGKPYRTSSVVRKIITQLYSTAPGGLPGNDDLGQTSSWYVFAALGMYPEIPGDDVLILNGPLFPQTVVHLTNGDLTITGNGAGDNAPYVQSLIVNGQTSNAPWIRFANVANGGTLAFSMSTTPNTNWGSNPLLAAPSYMDGMTAPLAQNYLWGTGLETNETQSSWINTVDTNAPGGGITNVGPIESGLSGPELGIRSENSQSGSCEIMYSGKALGGASDYDYMKAFDLSGKNVTISPGMHFSYWIFPQSHANNSLATGGNSAYVALDLIFTDGTDLWDSGMTNQYGVGVNPTNQASILALDTWNYVTMDLTTLAGKTVNRIDLGYSLPGSTGGYRGYVDDIAFTTPASLSLTNNLALNQPVSTDSQQTSNPASNGNDGNLTTRWSANDGNTNHWWQVDLGAICNLTGDEVVWQFNGAVYDYTVAVSQDNTNWTEVVNETANTSTAQDQAAVFTAIGRYVRISVTGLPAGDWASFDEFRVFGTIITPPSAPTGLQALAGYRLVDLNWPASAGATSYDVARSTSSGTETLIATTTTTNYTDMGLQNGTPYYYVVSAVNILGQQSGNSGEVNTTTLVTVPGSYAAAVVADKPLAYWPLNETNGTVAFDQVGGNNGTYVGGVTTGQPGVSLAAFGYPSYAALFDGTSGYVDIPSGPFNITNAITTIAWVNVPVIAHFSGLIGHGDSSWRMSASASGNPGGADGSSGDATSPTSIVDSGWHMVVYAYTGVPNTANNGSLYVDGVLEANDTISSVAGSGLDVWIGGAPDYGTGRLLPGSIAQVAVFTNALSAAQVQALYYIGTNTPPVTLTLVPLAAGNAMNLLWTRGTLLQTTNVAGPWITNTGASPYTVVPTNAQMYFRVRVSGP